MKLTEATKANILFRGDLVKRKDISILVLSNLTVNLFQEAILFQLYTNGFNPDITFGDYNAIVTDSKKAKDYDVVIVIWDLSNLIEFLPFKLSRMDNEEINKVQQQIFSQFDIVFENLNRASLAIVTEFSTVPFNNYSITKNAIDHFADILNRELTKRANKSTFLIDIDKIYSTLGSSQSVDYRFYNQFKALHKFDFFYKLSDKVATIINSLNGNIKKVLVLDCDNTLWNGVVGEDDYTGIRLSSNEKEGVPFYLVHEIIHSLYNKGVLLCLNSKNNIKDVEEVFSKREDFKLNSDWFIIKKVNWTDKASNLRDIALELNVGLDSLIFVDDSEYEINLVRKELPFVKCYQVPKKLYTYPELFLELSNEFFNPNLTTEDSNKTKQYIQENKRKNLKSESTNIESYLESLGLKIKYFINEKNHIERISQMTQKTNQFNFTTKRYTTTDIENFMSQESKCVISYSVSDNFGDYGITGLTIIDTEINEIDTFLMSCRIIGRNIEKAIFNILINQFKHNSHSFLLNHIYSKKNLVLEEVVNNLLLTADNKDEIKTTYSISFALMKPFQINYIEIQA